jgi:2-dehydro-3-deoxyphosphogluconate aldolase/(4S)-4-hydroxy-2-oxoglutarate aldolase
MHTLVNTILEKRVIVIVRKTYGEPLYRLAEALFEGGLRFLEVTFDHTDPEGIEKTCSAITALQKQLGSKGMHIGAGTVLTADQVDRAAAAGAQYIISPNVNTAVIARTKELGLVSIPGAMTPTEIVDADEAGADFIKVFPASFLGTKYIKDIRGPLGHIRYLATGGIGEQNFLEYIEAGYQGAGMGGVLVDRKEIEAKNWSEFTRRAASLTAMVNTLNGGM